MLMTEDEKKWLAELERRKRKVIEEEQSRLNDFNADQQRLLIFSHIFRIAPKLKRLSKSAYRKLKPRVLFFKQQCFDQNKVADFNDNQIIKNKDQTFNIHLSFYHNHKSDHMQKRVPVGLLQRYMANLKKPR